MTFRLFLGVSDSVALLTPVCFVPYIDKSVWRGFLRQLCPRPLGGCLPLCPPCLSTLPYVISAGRGLGLNLKAFFLAFFLSCEFLSFNLDFFHFGFKLDLWKFCAFWWAPQESEMPSPCAPWFVETEGAGAKEMSGGQKCALWLVLSLSGPMW